MTQKLKRTKAKAVRRNHPLRGNKLPKQLENINVTASAPVVLMAASPTEGESGLKRFSLNAYSGGAMNLGGLDSPAVFDLATLKAAPIVPLLYEHDPLEIIGHTNGIAIDPTKGVQAEGVLSGVSDRSNEVRTLAANGFPWQLSLMVRPKFVDFYAKGETVAVNGRKFDGPLYVARYGLIREVSFCSMGADPNTSASLLARLSSGVTNMPTFEEWLVSLGFDPAGLAAEVKDALQKAYDSIANTETTETTEETVVTEEVPAKAPAPVAAKVTQTGNLNASANAILTGLVDRIRTDVVTEQKRIENIKSLSARYGDPQVKGKSLMVTALEDKWTPERAELEMLKASRTVVHSGLSTDQKANGFKVIEASLAQAGKLKNLDKSFDAQTLDVAQKTYRGRLSLQEALLEGARLNGYNGPMTSSAFKSNLPQILRANFSTIEIPNILTNTVNKFLIDGFMQVDEGWRQIARTRSVTDLKSTTSYRLGGNFLFEKLGPDGKISHATVNEQAFTNKAETRAKMYAITRTDMINDDLGALTDLPKQLGRGGALGLSKDFWTVFLNNAAFFVAGNNNVSTGVFGSAALASAFNVFRKLKDTSGNFIMSTPRVLLVPPELELAAEQLRTATNVIGAPTTPVPETNIWAGKFEVVTSPYLSDPTITGNSAVAFYLLADPNDLAAVEVAFLNGQETPIVDTAEADFNRLGIQMRGYFDYGVALQDPASGVRSTGV